MNSTPVFIFDADGVLLDSLEQACDSFNQIAGVHFPGLPHVATKEDMVTVYPGPLKSSLRRFGLKQEQVKQFFELHTSAMLEIAHTVNPFDDVLSAIRRYAFGQCAIVSSALKETIEASLSRSREYTPGMFKFIRGREDGKDKATKIMEVLRDFGSGSDNAIYIGDMVSDILYCRSVPIKVAAVGYGYHPANYLLAFDPDMLFSNIGDLLNFLQQRAAVETL